MYTPTGSDASGYHQIEVRVDNPILKATLCDADSVRLNDDTSSSVFESVYDTIAASS